MLNCFVLEPPQQLISMIFPWVDDELAAYEARLIEHGPRATDFSLKNFLILLIEFRPILLQDAAVLYQSYPDLKVWNYLPFNTPLFQSFSRGSTDVMDRAEADARHRLESLPHTVSRSMQAILQTISIQRSQDETRRVKDQSEMSSHMNFFHGLMMNHLSSTSKGRQLSRDLGQSWQPPTTATGISNIVTFARSEISISFRYIICCSRKLWPYIPSFHYTTDTPQCAYMSSISNPCR